MPRLLQVVLMLMFCSGIAGFCKPRMVSPRQCRGWAVTVDASGRNKCWLWPFQKYGSARECHTYAKTVCAFKQRKVCLCKDVLHDNMERILDVTTARRDT
jgi:hypothetical protein